MSIVLMKNFVDSGKYRELKLVEARVEHIRNAVKDAQEKIGDKRMVWLSSGVVGKFISRNIYECDSVGLNEYLLDLGILPYCCSIDPKLLTDEEAAALDAVRIPAGHYVRYTPNKQGRVDMEAIHQECRWLDHASLEDCVANWKGMKLQFATLERQWEKARRVALTSALLHRKQKYTFSLGSLSLLPKQPEFAPADVFHTLGAETLLRVARAKMTDLDEYIAMGFLKKTDLAAYRRVVDVQLSYQLMELKAESDAYAFFSRRIARLSQVNRGFA